MIGCMLSKKKKHEEQLLDYIGFNSKGKQVLGW